MLTGDLGQCRAALDAAAIAGRVDDEASALQGICMPCNRLLSCYPCKAAGRLTERTLFLVEHE